jgi:hypothetical protein
MIAQYFRYAQWVSRSQLLSRLATHGSVINHKFRSFAPHMLVGLRRSLAGVPS